MWRQQDNNLRRDAISGEGGQLVNDVSLYSMGGYGHGGGSSAVDSTYSL